MLRDLKLKKEALRFLPFCADDVKLLEMYKAIWTKLKIQKMLN